MAEPKIPEGMAKYLEAAEKALVEAKKALEEGDWDKLDEPIFHLHLASMTAYKRMKASYTP